MTSRAHIFARTAAAFTLTSCSVSFGQQPTKIDPGTSDVSSNATSLRRLDVDLRKPEGFEGVYQLSKADAFGRGQNMFMRIDGGIIAIFPRSVYVPSSQGLVPVIPPGTIFQIGPIPQALAAPANVRLSDNYLDTRIGKPAPVPDPLVGREIPVARSMITNEIYRRRRLEALLTPEPT